MAQAMRIVAAAEQLDVRGTSVRPLENDVVAKMFSAT